MDEGLLWLGVSVVVLLLAVSGALYLRYRRRKHHPPKPVPPPVPPTTPPSGPCEIPADRAKDVLKGVYHPQRLTILNTCSYGKGTVVSVKKELDGDWHIDMKADPDSPAQPQGHPTLICEIIPYDQKLGLQAPAVGDHVVMYGPHVWDNIHGWAEVHPVWRVVIG